MQQFKPKSYTRYVSIISQLSSKTGIFIKNFNNISLAHLKCFVDFKMVFLYNTLFICTRIYLIIHTLVYFSAHISTPTQSRPSSAPPGTSSTPPPPGMSEYSKRRVVGDNPLNPESLEKAKIGVLKFLGAGLIDENLVVCHYVIASSDTRHR